MKHNIIRATLLSALLVCASLSFAADTKPGAAAEDKTTGTAKAVDAKAKKPAPPAKVKLVDINSASKKELKTLPGLSDEDADKIIAGRPYGSKAHLTTHNVISRAAYENLKALVIAKQKSDAKAKPAK